MKSVLKTTNFFLFLIYLFSAILIFQNIFLGVAEDGDSDAILLTLQAIQFGNYFPSRLYGVPGYEYIASVFYYFGDVLGVNIYSYILWIIYSFVLFKILRAFFTSFDGVIFLTLCLHPVILLNATAMMETMQVLVIVALIIYFYMKFTTSNDKFYIYLLSFLNILVVLTRPDTIFFSLVIFLSLLLYKGEKNYRNLIFVNTLFALFLIFIFYKILYMSHSIAMPISPISFSYDAIKFTRVILGLINAFGFIYLPFLLIYIFFIKCKFNIGKNVALFFRSTSPLSVLFKCALIVYSIRIILLPDEVEYLLIPLIIFLIYSSENFPRYMNYLLAISILSMHVAVPSIFLKMPIQSASHEMGYQYHISPSMQAGILEQEKFFRLLKIYLNSDEFIKDLEKSIALQIDSIYTKPFFSGFIINSDVIVTSKVGLWQLQNSSDNWALLAQKFNTLYLCDEDIVPNRGWRVMQKNIYYDHLNQKKLNCNNVSDMFITVKP
jgi:hypothetical protein